VLRTSPLDACHRGLGAKMVEFGGWEMPLAYPTGTLAEHRAILDELPAPEPEIARSWATVHIAGVEQWLASVL